MLLVFVCCAFHLSWCKTHQHCASCRVVLSVRACLSVCKNLTGTKKSGIFILQSHICEMARQQIRNAEYCTQCARLYSIVLRSTTFSQPLCTCTWSIGHKVLEGAPKLMIVISVLVINYLNLKLGPFKICTITTLKELGLHNKNKWPPFVSFVPPSYPLASWADMLSLPWHITSHLVSLVDLLSFSISFGKGLEPACLLLQHKVSIKLHS